MRGSLTRNLGFHWALCFSLIASVMAMTGASRLALAQESGESGQPAMSFGNMVSAAVQKHCQEFYATALQKAPADGRAFVLDEANRGVGCAQLLVGSASLEPGTSDFDLAKGVDWLNRAAAADPLFYSVLANGYYFGVDGIPEDKAKGIAFLERGAGKGCRPCSDLLGVFYDNGKEPLVRKDWRKAVAVLEPPAREGDAFAAFLLGDLYARDDASQGRSKDLPKSLRYLEQAAAWGSEPAQKELPLVQRLMALEPDSHVAAANPGKSDTSGSGSAATAGQELPAGGARDALVALFRAHCLNDADTETRQYESMAKALRSLEQAPTESMTNDLMQRDLRQLMGQIATFQMQPIQAEYAASARLFSHHADARVVSVAARDVGGRYDATIVVEDDAAGAEIHLPRQTTEHVILVRTGDTWQAHWQETPLELAVQQHNLRVVASYGKAARMANEAGHDPYSNSYECFHAETGIGPGLPQAPIVRGMIRGNCRMQGLLGN